jgi:hypothetical protein
MTVKPLGYIYRLWRQLLLLQPVEKWLPLHQEAMLEHLNKLSPAEPPWSRWQKLASGSHGNVG